MRHAGHGRWRRLAAALPVVAFVATSAGPGAYGIFTASRTASASYSTATLTAPSALAACVSVSPTGIRLSWTPGNASFTHEQRVLRRVPPTVPYTTIAPNLASGATTYTDTTAAPGITYEYQIEAFRNAWTAGSNVVGASLASNACV